MAAWAEIPQCRSREDHLLRKETLRRDGVWEESAFGLNKSDLRHLFDIQVEMPDGSEGLSSEKSGLKLMGDLV